jgi:hypothetical protein
MNKEELLSKILRNEGELTVEDVDEMNIPVNIFISEDEETKEICISAANFMPRRERVHENAYSLYVPDMETAKQIVQAFFLPIYEIALTQLKKNSTLYYWEIEEEEK